MSDDLITPMDVEREMIDLVQRIDKSPTVIRNHHNAVREARKAYRMAYNLAYRDAEGPVEERKVLAQIASQDEADALDLAEIQYRYVVDTLDSLKTKLRALQSVSSLMKAQMFNPQGGV